MSLSLPIGILGQVWYLIVLIPDLCTLTYITLICLDPHQNGEAGTVKLV